MYYKIIHWEESVWSLNYVLSGKNTNVLTQEMK